MPKIPDQYAARRIIDKHRQGRQEGKPAAVFYKTYHQEQTEDSDESKDNHLYQTFVGPLGDMIQTAEKTKEKYGKNRKAVCQAKK
jgi:hypothetical protein